MSRVILLALLATGCAATPAQEARLAEAGAASEVRLATALQGLSAGTPQTCIDRRDARDMAVYGDTILYRVSRRLVYRTRTNGGCRSLDRDNALVVRSPSNQLCRGDIATSFDTLSRIENGSCVFGEFTAYRRP